MGHTATIRFIDPVDPRTIWDTVLQIVEAPADYEWTRYAPGGEMGRDGCWFAKPEQGANSLAWMYYGPEGATLDDSEYTDYPSDDWAPEQIPPAGYVQVHLDTRYTYTDENIARAQALIGIVGQRAAMKDDFTGEWTIIAAV
jgi:hypothetical protein